MSNNTNKGTCCPNCGSREIEHHEATGSSICTSCGLVVEENAIVSSVEFVEGAGGQSSLMGQFVGASGSKAFSRGRGGAGGGGGGYGFGRDSRENTLANGRRRIQDVASRLRLSNHFVDTAHRFFTLAVEKNFVQGRRTTHVVAACLYIACRKEKDCQHMLIDFSDALQVNVYTLGTCFLKFRRLLGIQLEIIDPALYIYRFAAHLDLEDRANAVAITALRLVGRMKRDWIVSGRRPAGICAAALLIAARAHGFQKNHQDVTKILRVCGMTVAARVKDFESTPSANLTMEQFINVDLENECDPPVFTQNRIKEARALAIQEGNVELLTSGKLDDPRTGAKRASKWRNAVVESKNMKEMNQLYTQLASEMKNGEQENENGEDGEGGETSTATTPTTATTEPQSQSQSQNDLPPLSSPNNINNNQQLITQEDAQNITLSTIPFPKGPNGKDLIIPNQATYEELQKSTQKEEDKLNLSQWKSSMPQSAMDEIDDLFRDDEEVKQKEAIFNKMNKDYIEKQARKESERVAAEMAQKEREDDEAAQAEESARFYRKTKRRRMADDDYDGVDDGPSTQDALLAAISTRKTSRKINYDAMSSIFDDDGNFSTELLEDNEPNKQDTEIEV